MGNTQDTSATPAGSSPADKQELRAWACQWLEISADLSPAESRRQVFRLLAEQEFEAPPAFIEAAQIVAAEPEQLAKFNPVSTEYETWCDQRDHERLIPLALEFRKLPSDERLWRLGQHELRPMTVARLRGWLDFMGGARLPEFDQDCDEQELYEFALELAALPLTRRAVRRREILNRCRDSEWSKSARKMLRQWPELRKLDPRFFAGLLREETVIPVRNAAAPARPASTVEQEPSSWRGFGWVGTVVAIMVLRGCLSSIQPSPALSPTIYSNPQLRDEHGRYRYDFGQVDGRTKQLSADLLTTIASGQLAKDVLSRSTEDHVNSSLPDVDVQKILDSPSRRAALQKLIPTLPAVQVRRILKQYERSDESEEGGMYWDQLRTDLKARLDVLELQEVEQKAELGIHAGIPRSKHFTVATLLDSKGGREIVLGRVSELSTEAVRSAQALLEKRMSEFPDVGSDYLELLSVLDLRLEAIKDAGARGDNSQKGVSGFHLHFVVPARIDPVGSINLGSHIVETDEFLDQPWGLEQLSLRVPKLSVETLELLESALLRLESREPHRSYEIQKTQATIKAVYNTIIILNPSSN